MAKVAKIIIHTFSVACPHCKEWTSSDYNYSYDWHYEESCFNDDNKYTCSECEKTFSLPKRIA